MTYLESGTPVRTIRELPAVEVTMLACPDDVIEQLCSEAIAAEVIRPESVVFHCSGAYSSELLFSAKSVGAFVGSLHMVKSFAKRRY